MEIGERLRSIRESKKMTIYKVAQETGISHNHISDLERGARKPSVETLRRLVVPLGITLSELFSENEENIYLSEKERELIKNFRTLPNHQADKILELIISMNE
ncbi:MAG: helix-turn-helix transcriptional regulator [Ruminococcus flavefaciens]|nr:helix-turn-helix transcriptional regulator [Ruminococcus flavefaciens]